MQCMLQFIIQIRSNEFAFVQQIMQSCIFWVCFSFFPSLVCFIGAAVSGPWCHVWEEGETSGTRDWSRGRWRQLLCHWVVSNCAFEKWSMFLFSFLEWQGIPTPRWFPKETYFLQLLPLPFVFPCSPLGSHWLLDHLPRAIKCDRGGHPRGASTILLSCPFLLFFP